MSTRNVILTISILVIVMVSITSGVALAIGGWVGGGQNNTANGDWAAVGAGENNSADGNLTFFSRGLGLGEGSLHELRVVYRMHAARSG